MGVKRNLTIEPAILDAWKEEIGEIPNHTVLGIRTALEFYSIYVKDHDRDEEYAVQFNQRLKYDDNNQSSIVWEYTDELDFSDQGGLKGFKSQQLVRTLF